MTKKNDEAPLVLAGITEEEFMESNERCRKCFYRSMATDHACDYINLTGKARIEVSPGVGKDCTVFLPDTGKSRRPAALTVRIPESNADYFTEDPRQREYRQMKKLYEEGLNDREIAEEMRKPPATVRNWRLREGLSANSGRTRTGTAAVQERRRKMMELWSQGLNDREIAEGVQVTKKTVRAWREKFGLASNYKLRRGKIDADE